MYTYILHSYILHAKKLKCSLQPGFKNSLRSTSCGYTKAILRLDHFGQK